MAFELEGKLIKKFDTQQVSATFQKREFVVETDGQYPQKIKFEVTKDRCAALDSYNEGDRMKVHFDIRGNEWQGKYFNNLQAWKVEKAAAGTNSNNTSSNSSQENTPFPTPESEPTFTSKGNDAIDDLPF